MIFYNCGCLQTDMLATTNQNQNQQGMSTTKKTEYFPDLSIRLI